jgi:hypothetical protein
VNISYILELQVRETNKYSILHLSLSLFLPDDQFLVAFLRAKKYRIKDAFATVQNFANFWYRKADLIEGLCAAKIRGVYNIGMMQFLPNSRDKHGNIVTALRMGNLDLDPVEFNPQNMMKLSIYILTQLFEKEEMQLHGCCYVETFDGYSLRSSMKMSQMMGNNAEMKEQMDISLKTFPMRIRDIYVVKVALSIIDLSSPQLFTPLTLTMV